MSFGLILASILTFSACGSGDPVVARVAEAEIALSEVERFVAKLPQSRRDRDANLAIKVEHVWSVIDHHLLLQEARRRGLPVTVRDVLAAGERSRLAGLYRERSGIGQLDLGREEVEQAHIRWGMDRERYLARLVVIDEERLREALAQIKAGASLAAVKERYGTDDLVAGADGSVGWIGVEELARYFIPEEVFFSIENGRFAPVADLGGAWQSYRFEDTRSRSLEETWDEVHARLLRERTARQSHEEFEKLARELDLRIDGEGLAVALEMAADGVGPASVSHPDGDSPLFRFGDGAVTVGEFLADLLRYGHRGALRDSTQIAQLAESGILTSYLFAATARGERWDEEASFRAFAQRKEQGLLLEGLERQALEDLGPAVSEGEIRHYYEQYPDRFKVAESVVIQRLYVKSEKEAQALKHEIDLGAAVGQLLDRPSVAHYVDPRFRGVRRLFRIHGSRFPELVEAAFAAAVGEVIGPVPMVGGFAVFEVLEKLAPELRPYVEVRQEVRRILIEKRKEQAMIALIRKLRDEHRSQIRLYDIPASTGEDR